MRRLHRPTPRAFRAARPCPPGAPPAVSSRASGSTRGHGPFDAQISALRVTIFPRFPRPFAGAGSPQVAPAATWSTREYRDPRASAAITLAGGSVKPNAARILGPGRASAPRPSREPPVPPRKAIRLTGRRGVPNHGLGRGRAAWPGDPPPLRPYGQPCMGPPPALAGRQAFRRGARFALPRQKPRPDFRQQTGQGTTTRRAIYVHTSFFSLGRI